MGKGVTVVCTNPGCAELFDPDAPKGECKHHRPPAVIKRKRGILAQDQFLFYWCCGATNPSTPGCLRGQHKNEPAKPSAHATIMETVKVAQDKSGAGLQDTIARMHTPAASALQRGSSAGGHSASAGSAAQTGSSVAGDKKSRPSVALGHADFDSVVDETLHRPPKSNQVSPDKTENTATSPRGSPDKSAFGSTPDSPSKYLQINPMSPGETPTSTDGGGGGKERSASTDDIAAERDSDEEAFADF
eukprot:m.76230 g.76230  ORF g.76230 m.76230 type:complete len:246 (-) comp17222_c1_seq3:56-793(-)